MSAPSSSTFVRSRLGASRRQIWAIAAGTVVAALLAVNALSDGIVRDAAYLGVTVGAAVVACFGVRRRSKPRRAPWLLIALGVTLSAIADTIWSAYMWIRGEGPDASIADVFWIGSYVALFVGLLQLVGTKKHGGRNDVDAIIDMVAIGSVALVVAWQVSISATVADRSIPMSIRLVWAAYPILDAALLTLVLRTVVSYRGQARTGIILAFGVACWLGSDFFYLAVEPGEAVSIALDSGWMLGAAALAAAVWHRPTAEPAPEVIEQTLSRSRVGLSLAPLLIPAGIATWAHVRGTNINPWPLLALSVVLVALAYVRSVRMLNAATEAREHLQSRERHYRAVAANSSDAVFVLDYEGRVVNEVSRLSALLGYSGSALGVEAFSVVNPEDVDDVRAIFDKVRMTRGATFDTELRATHSDGSTMWLGARAVNLVDDPAVGGIVVTLHDITDRKHVEEELEHQAFHDVLTGLANRALFRNRVEHALDRTSRTDLVPALVYMDLDGFKTVNDSLGHDAGDLVLREVARRLRTAIRSGDTVARLGGDEFAILIEESHRPVEEAEGVAERALVALREPVQVEDQQIKLSASFGVAIGDDDLNASALLRNADVAMYRAKAAGKGQWVVFDPEMRAAAVERLHFETDLVGALDAGQFRLVYQPVIALESDQVVGFEALLRWDHPTRGTLTPDKFIPLIEENGLIVPIGAWVIREACRTAARWQVELASDDGLSMAVNLSARQLAWRDLVSEVAYSLEESGLEPSLLVLEITESVLVADAAVAARRLRELRGLGVRLAIDDFGTGYSSLSYLREFPVDILKIDKSFVDSITDSTKVPTIIRGLLDLGRTLNLETVAEGVELAVQRDQLRAEHCDFAQGFLYAEPLDVDEVELLLMRRAGHRRGAGDQSVEIGPPA